MPERKVGRYIPTLLGTLLCCVLLVAVVAVHARQYRAQQAQAAVMVGVQAAHAEQLRLLNEINDRLRRADEP